MRAFLGRLFYQQHNVKETFITRLVVLLIKMVQYKRQSNNQSSRDGCAIFHFRSFWNMRLRNAHSRACGKPNWKTTIPGILMTTTSGLLSRKRSRQSVKTVWHASRIGLMSNRNAGRPYKIQVQSKDSRKVSYWVLIRHYAHLLHNLLSNNISPINL